MNIFLGDVMKLMLEHCNTKKNTLFSWLCITLMSMSKYNAIIATEQFFLPFGFSSTRLGDLRVEQSDTLINPPVFVFENDYFVRIM